MAQAYSWSYDEILKLTYPQIILMNHAAEVNRKRMDERIRERRGDGKGDLPGGLEEPTIEGKKVSEVTTEEYLKHLGQSDGVVRGKVIKPKRN